MNQIRTLKNLDNGNKLGDAPANYYPPSRTELEEQFSCAKKDREIAIYWGNQFADNYNVLDREKYIYRNNEKLSDRVHQLGEETMQLQSEIDNFKLGDEIRYLHSEINNLKLQITRKDISFADTKSKFSIKSEEMQALQSKMEEEIQALQSRVKELEQDLSLAQNELSEMKSLKNESELENTNLFLAKLDLEKTLSRERDELIQIKDDL
ncbi:23055_t:CDS:2, partial [Gigaspora margarita]